MEDMQLALRCFSMKPRVAHHRGDRIRKDIDDRKLI
jgi:hypothetical protein